MTGRCPHSHLAVTGQVYVLARRSMYGASIEARPSKNGPDDVNYRRKQSRGLARPGEPYDTTLTKISVSGETMLESGNSVA
jgi:hypothetical protein